MTFVRVPPKEEKEEAENNDIEMQELVKVLVQPDSHKESERPKKPDCPRLARIREKSTTMLSSSLNDQHNKKKKTMNAHPI